MGSPFSICSFISVSAIALSAHADTNARVRNYGQTWFFNKSKPYALMVTFGVRNAGHSLRVERGAQWIYPNKVIGLSGWHGPC
jgi:hypothetical protein